MDIYKEITDRIITQMENGIIPWQKPWIAGSTTAAISHTTGKPYSLLNQMLLGRAGEYATFKQIQAAGGRVRKGEKASMIALYLYLCGNQNNFCMGLSPTAIKNELGFSASSYHRGKNDLKREGYLIVSERSDHVLDFYTTPQCTQSKMTAAATPDTSAPAASAPSMQTEPSNDSFSFDSSYGWED